MDEASRKKIDQHLRRARQALNHARDPERARWHVAAALDAMDWVDLPRLQMGPQSKPD